MNDDVPVFDIVGPIDSKRQRCRMRLGDQLHDLQTRQFRRLLGRQPLTVAKMSRHRDRHLGPRFAKEHLCVFLERLEDLGRDLLGV